MSVRDPVPLGAALLVQLLPLFCEEPGGAFPNAAAGSGDYYDFVGDI